jgi:sugar (pentulose or hexulose) kinase
VSLDYQLTSGDTCEIFTSKVETAGPSQDWLTFVKSPRARNKIRQWFSRERRVDMIENGREELADAFRREGLPVQRMWSSDQLKIVIHDMSYADLDALLAAAARLPADGPRVDVDDPAFIPPGGMPERIAAAAGRRSLSPAEATRCILDSLADAYARTVRRAAELAGTAVEVVHVVGGGSQNELLCRLTAEACGLPVLAGPVEATALGNVLVQARAHGAAPATLEGLRSLVAASFPLRRYDP